MSFILYIWDVFMCCAHAGTICWTGHQASKCTFVFFREKSCSVCHQEKTEIYFRLSVWAWWLSWIFTENNLPTSSNYLAILAFWMHFLHPLCIFHTVSIPFLFVGLFFVEICRFVVPGHFNGCLWCYQKTFLLESFTDRSFRCLWVLAVPLIVWWFLSEILSIKDFRLSSIRIQLGVWVYSTG